MIPDDELTKIRAVAEDAAQYQRGDRSMMAGEALSSFANRVTAKIIVDLVDEILAARSTTADATPDDEAAWREWFNAQSWQDLTDIRRAAFLAGRVSGRADAAAQARVEELREAAETLSAVMWRRPPGTPPDQFVKAFLNNIADRIEAAQYREKGKAQ